MARKPKPEHIYREEVHGAGTYNSTRQTFDKNLFDAWVEYALLRDSLPGYETLFFVGKINWTEVSHDSPRTD